MFGALTRWISNIGYERRRAKYGTWLLVDPRPTKAENPFTFFVPPDEVVAKIGPGEIVKLIFVSDPPSRRTGAERMWVQVTARDGEHLHGTLDNVPIDTPNLALNDPVEFEAYHIVALDRSSKLWDGVDNDSEDRYMARCLVDGSVLDGSRPIGLIFREEPDVLENSPYPDSGWRIRSDQRGRSDADIDVEEVIRVAIGVILNKDASFLDLLNSPVGSVYERNWETGTFEPGTFELRDEG